MLEKTTACSLKNSITYTYWKTKLLRITQNSTAHQVDFFSLILTLFPDVTPLPHLLLRYYDTMLLRVSDIYNRTALFYFTPTIGLLPDSIRYCFTNTP